MDMRVPFAIAALPLAMIAMYSLDRGVPAGVFGAGAQQHAPIHARVDHLHEQ